MSPLRSSRGGSWAVETRGRVGATLRSPRSVRDGTPSTASRPYRGLRRVDRRLSPGMCPFTGDFHDVQDLRTTRTTRDPDFCTATVYELDAPATSGIVQVVDREVAALTHPAVQRDLHARPAPPLRDAQLTRVRRARARPPQMAWGRGSGVSERPERPCCSSLCDLPLLHVFHAKVS